MWKPPLHRCGGGFYMMCLFCTLALMLNSWGKRCLRWWPQKRRSAHADTALCSLGLQQVGKR